MKYCECKLPCRCNWPVGGVGTVCGECKNGHHMDATGSRGGPYGEHGHWNAQMAAECDCI